MAIPVIDFSKLGGEERAETLAEIHNCCEQWGFFQLVNHGVPEELLERVKKVSTEWYYKEREEGFNNSKPVKMMEEIMDKGSQQDKVEGVDWEDVFTLLDDDDHHHCPSITPGFKETMGEYRREIKKLAHKVMEVMDENLGLPKGYINRAFNDNDDENETAFFGTKVCHYPPCPHPEKAIGLRAHTDAGGVILLYQDDKVGGLQILKDGEWIDVQPIPNAIVINTGDQIEVLSNGKYKSVWHRILPTLDGNRRSIASFYNPSLKATISPALELVDKERNGDAYPKFLFGDYMSVYAQQKFLAKEPRFQALRAV